MHVYSFTIFFTSITFYPFISANATAPSSRALHRNPMATDEDPDALQSKPDAKEKVPTSPRSQFALVTPPVRNAPWDSIHMVLNSKCIMFPSNGFQYLLFLTIPDYEIKCRISLAELNYRRFTTRIYMNLFQITNLPLKPWKKLRIKIRLVQMFQYKINWFFCTQPLIEFFVAHSYADAIDPLE